MPRFVADSYVVEGRLKATALAHAMSSANLTIVYPSSGQVPRKVAAFRDFVVARLKTRPLGV